MDIFLNCVPYMHVVGQAWKSVHQLVSDFVYAKIIR